MMKGMLQSKKGMKEQENDNKAQERAQLIVWR